MAVQEAVEGFPMTLNAGAPLGRANEKMAAPIAARKAVGASPLAATAVGPPAKKNYEKGKPPMAALMLLLLLGTGLPPIAM